MTGPRMRGFALLAIGFSVGAIVVGAAGGARYETADGTPVTSIKLTGGGLPDLGVAETYGAAELPSEIRSYHDSGRYDRDVGDVVSKAERSLRHQLRRLRRPPGPGYERCRTRRGELECAQVKPAIVLDIDETSLSNYDGLSATSFSAVGLIPGSVLGNGRPIEPTLELYRYARSKGVEAFFITGRPEAVRAPSERNLTEVGYEHGFTLIMKSSGIETIPYKSGERRRIESELGFEILINVGDQDSDLAGGHARRAFKLPNPMYHIP